MTRVRAAYNRDYGQGGDCLNRRTLNLAVRYYGSVKQVRRACAKHVY
ncbi:MAG TPA: hypothetical protein VF089_10190 [Candidatus Binatia bacterium]